MSTKRVSLGNGEELRVRGKDQGSCDVHEWPTDGLAKRLVQAARDRHPKGINACKSCIDRAVEDRNRSR